MKAVFFYLSATTIVSITTLPLASNNGVTLPSPTFCFEHYL